MKLLIMHSLYPLRCSLMLSSHLCLGLASVPSSQPHVTLTSMGCNPVKAIFDYAINLRLSCAVYLSVGATGLRQQTRGFHPKWEGGTHPYLLHDKDITPRDIM